MKDEVAQICSCDHNHEEALRSDAPIAAGQCLGTWPQSGFANEQWTAVGQAYSAAEHLSSSPPVTSQEGVRYGVKGPALSSLSKQASQVQHSLPDTAGRPSSSLDT